MGNKIVSYRIDELIDIHKEIDLYIAWYIDKGKLYELKINL